MLKPDVWHGCSSDSHETSDRDVITRWHGSVMSVLRTTRKSIGKREIRPPLPQKQVNWSSPEFSWMIRSRTFTHMQNFITMRLPLFALPQKCEKCASIDSDIAFWFCQPTAKTPAPICTIGTSNDVVLRKNVPFGSHKNKLYISNPFLCKKGKFGPIFDGT